MTTIFGASARFNAPWKVANGSWALSLRAEREKEPNLDAVLPREVQQKTTPSPRAIICEVKVPGPLRRIEVAKARDVEETGHAHEPPKAELCGDPPEEWKELQSTIHFWKYYASMAKKEKGLPAWHEEPSSLVLPQVRSSATRTWATEAAVQRKALVPRANAREAAVALHLEAKFRSKERLRRMIRTGQMEKAKKEMRATLPLMSETRPVEAEDAVATFGPSKEQALSLKQQGDAQEALKMMSRQRTELTKARRALENALERRRESQMRLEKLEKLQQVKELIGLDRGLLHRDNSRESSFHSLPP